MAKQRFTAGHYYGIKRDGEAVPLQPREGAVPDVVMARRLADFPRQRVPPGGSVVPCIDCQQPVVTNLLKFPSVPRRCMQCSDVMPEPMEDPS